MDIFPQTARTRKRLWTCSFKRENGKDILHIQTSHVETVVQLVRKKPDTYIDVTIDMDYLDLTSSEAKATYDEIKDYIFDKLCVKVSSLYIAQVKQNTVLSKEIVTIIQKKITQNNLNAHLKR